MLDVSKYTRLIKTNTMLSFVWGIYIDKYKWTSKKSQRVIYEEGIGRGGKRDSDGVNNFKVYYIYV
jgi:hypothetical protein